jgi:hypothetical protein
MKIFKFIKNLIVKEKPENKVEHIAGLKCENIGCIYQRNNKSDCSDCYYYKMWHNWYIKENKNDHIWLFYNWIVCFWFIGNYNLHCSVYMVYVWGFNLFMEVIQWYGLFALNVE